MNISLLKSFVQGCILAIVAALFFNISSLANNDTYNDQRSAKTSAIVLNNNLNVLPLINIDQMTIASVNIGFNYSTAFDSILNKYQKVSSWDVKNYRDSSSLNVLRDDLRFYNTLIIQLSDVTITDQEVIAFIKEAQTTKQVIVAFFGTGKTLYQLDDIKSPIIFCEQNSLMGAKYVAQLIFGGVATKDVLKKSHSPVYQVGLGDVIKKIRLGYTDPTALTIDTLCLQQIDTIALEAIRQKATPSAVVLVVKDGQVIYNKAFGAHTYGGKSTKIDDIYDLASVTKIAATTLAVMRLIEKEKINLNAPLKNYIGRTRGTNKSTLTIRELMLHQAGLIPYIPFYKKLVPTDYATTANDTFTVKVTDHFYLRKNYLEDVMWPQMLKSPLYSRGKYVYSDLSMNYIKEVIEDVSGKRLDKYLTSEFYQPLGMKRTSFNPREHFNPDQIVPTENDTLFRKTLLLGYVHDQGAAMMGGVAGNAGLFASANDLAILFQMFLNGGSYGGKQYFDTKTIQLFTSKQSKVSRRGLGFDRRDPDANKNYPSQLASSQVYGHTGFTGTCVWVDPKYKLIYIFLSNRLNPEISNKLSALGIRGRIQDVIYEAILSNKRN